MTEFLDVYDANRRHLGTADRNVVHECGLWHKTVHCWVVWNGKLLFQRRARNLDNNPGKLYTTASGHVSAGEDLPTAFAREVAQEIGLENISSPGHLYETIWVADIIKTNGKLFCDRVFVNVYFVKYDGELSDLKFTDGEVESVVAIDMKEFIAFAYDAGGSVSAIEFDGREIQDITISEKDFVLNTNENIYQKYGKIAEQIAKEIK